MNYKGSYRNLLKNSKAALLASIEIYNKPSFEYRDECFSILLLNAWELLLKAILSKNKISIFYKKKRGENRRTLSWADALVKCKPYIGNDYVPLSKNLELLATYRDNAVHFYNKKDMSALIYSLSQTAIVNFKDTTKNVFDDDITETMTWQLLPIGVNTPTDPIEFLKKKKSTSDQNSAVGQFLVRLAEATKEVESTGSDAGRLMTVFVLNLQSTKKIENADVIVGVTKANQDGLTTIIKPTDPNITHPLRQSEMVNELKQKFGGSFTTHTFQALSWHLKLKEQPHYCWKASSGVLTCYSRDALTFLKKVSADDISNAKRLYAEHQRKRRSAAGKA